MLRDTSVHVLVGEKSTCHLLTRPFTPLLLDGYFIVSGEIGFNLFGMIVRVCQRIMHICWPQVCVLLDDLLNGHPLSIASQDDRDTNTGACDSCPATASLGVFFDISVVHF